MYRYVLIWICSVLPCTDVEVRNRYALPLVHGIDLYVSALRCGDREKEPLVFGLRFARALSRTTPKPKNPNAKPEP